MKLLFFLATKGCIVELKNDNNRLLKTQKTERHDSLFDKDLYCINPPLFAQAIALLHRDDKNVQDLVIKVSLY